MIGREKFRRHLEQYISLSDSEFDEVLTYFSQKRVARDGFLIRAGDLVQHTYWVVEGMVASGFTDKEGKEHLMQFAMEECWVTDQNAFYNRDRAMLNVVAYEDTTALAISFDNREKLCTSMHKMETFFRRRANSSFVKQQQRLLTYMTSDARQRLDLLLKEFPGILQRVSKKTLAAYLGVSRETLSRFKIS